MICYWLLLLAFAIGVGVDRINITLLKIILDELLNRQL